MACAERTADWEASRSFAGMQLRQRWPAFKLSQVLKFQVREIDCVADVHDGFIIAITVINGAEAALLRAQIGKRTFVRVPELKRKLAFDTFVMRLRDGGDLISLVTP